MSHSKIRNIIVISDTHFGCQFGLCPKDGFKLDEGGIYLPNRMQKVTWNWWEEFWDDWVPKQTRGQPFICVHNGDVIDGSHHNAVTQISHNINDQRRLAIATLKPYVARAARFYAVRGTEAHVGKSAQEEEAVAKALGAVPNQEGQHARYELWLPLGKTHQVHFLHHIGGSGNALRAELDGMLKNAARWRTQPPTVIVRSHLHEHNECRQTAAHGYITGVITPGWQLKTPFAWKIAGARISPPQLGGVAIRADDDGNLYTNAYVKTIERSVCE